MKKAQYFRRTTSGVKLVQKNLRLLAKKKKICRPDSPPGSEDRPSRLRPRPFPDVTCDLRSVYGGGGGGTGRTRIMSRVAKNKREEMQREETPKSSSKTGSLCRYRRRRRSRRLYTTTRWRPVSVYTRARTTHKTCIQ